MSTPELPVPTPTALSKPFWDACQAHKLKIQTCTRCGYRMSIPEDRCRNCQSVDLDWIDASGRGSIYSYTVAWRPPTPAFKTPYVVAIVRLEEGADLMTNIVDCPIDSLTVGMPVTVTFEDRGEMVVPVFRPTAEDP